MTHPDVERAPRQSILYPALAILFSVLWASAFMGVKVALKSSPPLFLMSFRFVLAGGSLLLAARVLGYSFPKTRREWWQLAVLGILNNTLYLGLSAIALRHLSGGMGAVFASTNPLMLAVAAAFLLRERLYLAKGIGLLLAFGSVVLIMYSRMGTDDTLGAMLLILLANALMVVGTILFKRWAPQQHLTVLNGVQLLVAALGLLVPSLLTEQPWATVDWNLHFLGAIAYLAFGVSCGAMLIWFYLLRTGEASKASSFFFLNPVLGLFMGALLLDEPLHALDFLGSAGVGLGIYLVLRPR